MMTKLWRLPSLALGIALAMFAGSIPAAAGTASSDGDDPLNAIAQITSFAPPGFVAPRQHRTGNAPGEAVARGVVAQLPDQAQKGLTLTANDQSLTLGLPDASRSRTKSSSDGVIYYDNPDGTSIVPTLRENGALQVLSVSTRASSSSRLAYELDLPDRVRASSDGTGGYYLQDPAGRTVGVITAPWALDASGKQVPTHYEWDGRVLVQHIDLDTPGIAFPVVADPTIYYFWWGYGIKYSKSETAQIANSNPTTAVLIVCNFIPHYGARVACIAVAYSIINLYWSVFESARDHGKCAQLNIPYASPPAPPIVYEVSC